MQKQTFQIGKNFIPGVLFSACSAVLLLFATLMIASPTATLTNATDEPDYADGLSLITNQTIEATIRPEETGSLSIIKDTVIGATNSQYGYEVYISTNSDTVNDIYLDGNPDNNETTQVISATSGTYATPAVLDITNGATWGYAVAGLDNFDASYNEASPATTAKFAAVPTSDDKQLVHRNTSAAADDNFDVYYGINADSTLEPGLYKTEIIYTAVPIIPPLTAKAVLGNNGNLNFVYNHNTYEIGDMYTDNLGETEIIGVYEVPVESNGVNNSFQSSLAQNSTTSINFDTSFNGFEPTSTRYWFNGYSKLVTITNASNLNTSLVTDMSYMFWGASRSAHADINIDLSDWDVGNVENMYSMFYNCGDSLGSDYNWTLNLDGWDVSHVKNMGNMFAHTGRYAKTWNLSVRNWDLASLENASTMFYYAGGSVADWALDLSSWEIHGGAAFNGGDYPNDRSRLFEAAGQNVTDTWSLNLSGWDTSSMTSLRGIFNNAGAYAEKSWSLNLSNWDVSNVTDMHQVFDDAGAYAEESWYLNLDGWDVGSAVDMAWMFSEAGKKAASWTISDLSGWDLSNAIDLCSMFFSAGENANEWDIGNLGYVDTSHPGWDVSKVENMASMFGNTGKKTTNWSVGDLSSWNVGSVTNMSGMFQDAGYNATTWNIGDISNWNVGNVTNMYAMFDNAGYNATTWNIGDISGWIVSSVTNHGNFIAANANSTNLSVVNNQPNWP